MHLDLQESLWELIILFAILFAVLTNFALFLDYFREPNVFTAHCKHFQLHQQEKCLGMYFYYEGSLVRPYQINRSFTVLFPYQVTPTLEVLFDFIDSWDEGSITIPAFSPKWNFFDAFRAKLGPDPH